MRPTVPATTTPNLSDVREQPSSEPAAPRGDVREQPYTIRRSDRARRIRVTVDVQHGVQVVLPRRVPEREAAAVVRELQPWIDARMAEVEAQRAQVSARGDRVPYLGRMLTLVPEPGRTRVHRIGETLLVPGDPAAPGERRAALERWYRRTARAEFLPRLEQACAALGRPCAPLTVRGQRTRWGSCSTKGAISLNWRLLLAPEPALDYVVWHEVCHLEQMNHSAAFWALVAANCPGYRAQAAWLRRNGGSLVL
jgi:predicted metal-dependent hydrolase